MDYEPDWSESESNESNDSLDSFENYALNVLSDVAFRTLRTINYGDMSLNNVLFQAWYEKYSIQECSDHIIKSLGIQSLTYSDSK